MVKIFLSGCNGRMGQVINSCVCTRDDCEIVAGADIFTEQKNGFPVFKSIAEFDGDCDVIIDFSNPSALDGILDFATRKKIPVVLATTGYSDRQKEKITAASQITPVFYTANMSIGVNLIAELCKRAATVLEDDFDIEIIEAHHNQKLDAPSGTANMLAEAVIEGCNNKKQLIYDRHDRRQKRDKDEIGMHAVRGGTIVGEHSVMFAGRDEIITVSHSARSREIFAVGGLNAALFMVGKPAGLYNMGDLIGKC